MSRLERIQSEKGRHYHRLFNDLLGELGLDERDRLPELLEIFGGVRPDLRLFPGARELLLDLKARCRLGLITSGRPEVQENKIRLLGIAGFFDSVVFSSSLAENKPGQLPFRRLLETLRIEPARAAYIGDNPLLDFRGANELGMLTVRVRRRAFDEFKGEAGQDARFQVDAVADLRGLLFGRNQGG